MLNIIQYSDIKKYKLYIPFDTNNNSTLYYDGNIIHKIPFHIDKHLEWDINYIHSLNNNQIIELTNLVYNNDILKGYSFIKYRDYKSLNYHKNRDLELKKADCFELLRLFNFLNSYNLKYTDFHPGNILLNEKTGQIKLCDLDSLKIVTSYDIKKDQLRNIATFCLSYLYNLDYFNIMILLKERYPINNSEVNAYFTSINENFHKILNDINLDLIEKERPSLKKEANRLVKTGYYSRYYL